MTVPPSVPGHPLTDLPATRLHDPAALSAAVIAAGAALGLMAHGTPVVRGGPLGTAIALLAPGGHVIAQADPTAGRCLVDILVPAGGSPERGLMAMIRRPGSAT